MPHAMSTRAIVSRSIPRSLTQNTRCSVANAAEWPAVAAHRSLGTSARTLSTSTTCQIRLASKICVRKHAQDHAYSTLHQSSRTQSGRRRWGPVTIGLALCPIITFGLGTWQVQRLRWKVDLIENLEDRMSLDAIPLPRKVNLEAVEDFEYRKVKVTGHFRHDQEILLGPRTRGDGQPGYFLITPFERTNGSKILVRRGWVPREKKDQSTRLEGLTEGEITLEGLLRTGEQKASSFVPENNPEKNEWYSLDLETMAKQTDAQPVVVEMILDTPAHLVKSELIDKNIPVGRSPVVELRNHHKEYIVTWYSLCVATTAMLYILMRRPPPPKKVTHMLPRHV